MSQVTELASGQITSTESIIVELVEADETPGRGHHPLAGQADRPTSAAFPGRCGRHRTHVR